MKKAITFILFGALVSCTVSEEGLAKKAKSEDNIEMILLQSDYALSVNQTASISVSEHASIGETTQVSISDNKIMGIAAEEFVYDDKSGDIKPGGDRGMKTYVFKAIAAGTCKITLIEGYRSETRHEYVFNFTVK